MAKHRYTDTFFFSVFEKKVCNDFFKNPMESLTNLFVNIRKSNKNKPKSLKVLVKKVSYEVVVIGEKETAAIYDLYKKYENVFNKSFVNFTDSSGVSPYDYKYLVDLHLNWAFDDYKDIKKYCIENKFLLVRPERQGSNLYVLTNDESTMVKLKLKMDSCDVINLEEIQEIKKIVDSKIKGL